MIVVVYDKRSGGLVPFQWSTLGEIILLGNRTEEDIDHIHVKTVRARDVDFDRGVLING